MHAFLINSTDEEEIQKEINIIVKDKKHETLEYEVKAINDARRLIKFLNLRLVKPTAFIIRKLDQASKEALNALLKVSEEPQEDALIIATCGNIHNLPQTIVSRFQIISPKTKIKQDKYNVEKFLKSSTSRKFAFLDKLSNKDDACEFLEGVEAYCQNLIKNKVDLNFAVHLAEISRDTYLAIKANGNLNLQFTNFIVNVNLLKTS